MDNTQFRKSEAAELSRKIRELLPLALLQDKSWAAQKLQRILQRKHGIGDRSLVQDLNFLIKKLEESARERENRLRRKPRLHFPKELPITARRHDIVRAIRQNRVVIISGETGCGKSTQIPKMCLEAGQGISGKVGCTQPRRIAAITIAHRIAEELGETLGRSVGYKIRFQDKTPHEAYIKIMTDGMLLAETQSDRMLYEYDTLIIDEAHERSLNIDFLLGIARTLVDLRPELKLIITSATLDTEKFSQAFHNAPVIHVSGRMYPVDLEYLPPESAPGDLDAADYVDLAVYAINLIKTKKRPGDILVFMPTEQDILETCERLEGKRYSGTSVLPLYARLPAAQQGRVYSVAGPKIVIATNVAETSLTIPGIRYVIDTGLARISEYQPGTRIHSLPISPVSRSSADQRKGRCGRVEAGLCIRLYSQEDYESRPQFTPPEILRSNLAEVILRMIFLRLGLPSDFPFVDKPQPKNIKDGYETLSELGATTGKPPDTELTPLGRQMAQMPLDPRISRMLLEAAKEGCVHEVAVIASVLGIRDPRERPPEKAAQADEKHGLFKNSDSDFLTLLNIWDRYHSPSGNLTSRNKQRQFCQEHFLSFTRMREWVYVHDQILSIMKEQGIPLGRTEKTEISASLYAGIHRSILSGFLSNIAVHKEKNFYEAAKGREVMVFPGSALFGKSRPWIVAAEMVRTSRLFARTAARIDPGWLEELGGDLCRYSYSEPRWDKDRGEVRATERVNLFGLEIVSGRDVPYGPVNPEEAHGIFIRKALVEGQIKEPPAFLKHNLALVQKISTMEQKLRRRDILAGDEALADFYSQRLAGVYDLSGLEKRMRAKGSDDFLRMGEKDVLLFFPDDKELALFPDEIALGDRKFSASYKFAPGDEGDGVTVKVPSALIKSLPPESLEWGAPGQFKEKVAALIKGLPKRYRKLLLPASEKAEAIVKEMTVSDPSLFKNLARFVKEKFQVDIPSTEWEKADIPIYLRTRVSVTDTFGRELASSRDLELLKKTLKPSGVAEDSPVWKKAKEQWERTGLDSWDFGPLPESILIGPFIVGYPGLEPADKGVNLRLYKTKEEAEASHIKGVEALLLPRFAKDLEFMKRYLTLPEEFATAALYFGGKSALEKGVIEALRKDIFQKNLRSKEDLESYAATIVRALFERGHAWREATLRVLDAYQKTRRTLQEIDQAGRSGRTLSALLAQIREELENLVPNNFLEIYSLERIAHLPRYLGALMLRAERASNDPQKDLKKAAQAEGFIKAFEQLQKRISRQASPEKKKAVEELRWMIEEFKVSLFAPELKTPFPISAKRLVAKLKEIGEVD